MSRQKLRMGTEEFREAVAEALDGLPEEVRSATRNLAVVVREEPTEEEIRSVGLDPAVDTLFGLYEGPSLVEEEDLFPARITIFRLPLLRECASRRELVEEIRLTVLHELGHHFGLREDDLP